MSTTAMVKEEILCVLKDNKLHSAAEIKRIIREKHPDKNITEGVFANALRTMTIAGECQNPDRGSYRISDYEKNKRINHTNDYKKLPYQDLKNKVIKIAEDMRQSFGEMVKDVDVFSDDTEIVQYILRVRAAMDRFENEIKN